ncbi:hypothetical protein [Primorskyibacter sp. S187A]|uniref:hypothetical protein n=1 Tax=Primorskyibacter sp. S187A TaxID=3415130 RepID=UPI003C79830A
MHQGAISCDPEFETAEAVSNHLLVVTRDALFSGDMEAYCARFHIPSVLRTSETVTHITNKAQLEEIFQGMQRYIHDTGAIDLHRVVTSARFLSADKIECHFESRWVTANHHLSQPRRNSGIAELRHGRWTIMSSAYDVSNNALLHMALSRKGAS